MQGYGAKSASDSFIYPGSGSTVDSRMPAAVAAQMNGTAEPNGSLGPDESPDAEFLSTAEEAPPALEGPRIINVGIGTSGLVPCMCHSRLATPPQQDSCIQCCRPAALLPLKRCCLPCAERIRSQAVSKSAGVTRRASPCFLDSASGFSSHEQQFKCLKMMFWCVLL